MWGATIQTERKSPWNWDLENLKTFGLLEILLLRRTASRLVLIRLFQQGTIYGAAEIRALLTLAIWAS